jgi:uncharacterized lipoprotein YddW (UPF0748 family)
VKHFCETCSVEQVFFFLIKKFVTFRVLANVIQEQQPLIWEELETIVSFSQNVSALWLREAETTLKTTRKQLELVSSQLLKMQNNTIFVKVFSKFNTVTNFCLFFLVLFFIFYFV